MSAEGEAIEARVVEILAREEIEYEAKFLPASQAKREWKGGDGKEVPVASWTITLKKGGRSFETVWSAGWGHYFSQEWGRIASLYDWVKRAMETGKRPVDKSQVGRVIMKTEPLPAPKPGEVIYSLSMDSEVLEYGCFGDWASELGYEEDSRKAEKIYQECLKVALSLRAVVGDGVLSELREAVREY